MKKEELLNYPIYLHLIRKKGKKGIELRKACYEPETIRIIIERAILGKPIVIFPTFLDRIRAIATLNEKGYIRYNYQKKECKFLI